MGKGPHICNVDKSKLSSLEGHTHGCGDLQTRDQISRQDIEKGKPYWSE
jgi:hypothetical protein